MEHWCAGVVIASSVMVFGEILPAGFIVTFLRHRDQQDVTK
jgi:hypothetical protein